MPEYYEKIRVEWAINDAKRDEGLSTPPDIIRYDDISYGADNKWNKLDVYRPVGKEGVRLPVIINVHGGAYVYGDKELYQYYSMDLARRGFAVVNFSYRLAPEHKHPAQLEDINSVASWIIENSEKYLLDVDNIFGVGDSAGGNLIGLYSCVLSNKEYANKYDFKAPKLFHFNAIAINCGLIVLNDRSMFGEDTDEILEYLLPCGGSVEERNEITVTDHITNDFPPTFIMTAQEDFLNSHAPVLANKLVEMKVPFLLRFYVDKEDTLYHVFHVDIRRESAIKCNDEECEFFKSYIK